MWQNRQVWLHGDVQILRPGEANYDEARQVWNAMIHRRPAMIARCWQTSDVVTAICAGPPGRTGDRRTVRRP
jgi:hypothetical protein